MTRMERWHASRGDERMAAHAAELGSPEPDGEYAAHWLNILWTLREQAEADDRADAE